jgi:hypothetical protein
MECVGITLEKEQKLSTKNLALTQLVCMLRRLCKIIFTTSWYPLEIQWGYVHGMSFDLDKYIYPNCLNKVTAYVYVALLLCNTKEYVLIKKGASFNIIILMVLRKKPS